MIVIEVVGGVVLAGMGFAVIWMAIVGLIGATGVLALKRCRHCGHLHTGWMLAQPGVCFYCHHPRVGRLVPLRVEHVFASEMDPASPETIPAGPSGRAKLRVRRVRRR